MVGSYERYKMLKFYKLRIGNLKQSYNIHIIRLIHGQKIIKIKIQLFNSYFDTI